MTLLITNISKLMGISQQSQFLKGKEMSHVQSIENAFLLIAHGKIADYGSMDSVPTIADATVDAKGGMVMPTWCDSHTHIVFAGSRENEYVLRLQGKSYEAIAHAGGGILNSAKKLAETSESSLYESALSRLEEVISYGTGAIEIKSGYGLSKESELKMLRVIRRLKDNTKATIKASFLGAHAIPAEYAHNREAYIREVIDMIPEVVDEGLADYCDVFCDKGFFTVEETDRILQEAAKYGLKPKIHANELAVSGGVQVGIKNQAISVDHLEAITQDEIDALLLSKTIPTVLPFVSFFLNIHYAPARQMIDQGLGVAIATDFNPGSSPCGSVPLLMAFACNGMRLLPNEAFNAVTINGACAMELEQELGTIQKGKKANFIITKPMSDLDFMIYRFGANHISKVYLDGELQ
ncbi:MAG: imidazolonepropionase [Saprospiraceae bacterium]